MSVISEEKNFSEIRVESSTVISVDQVESDWCNLQELSDCSYFQSWSWIGVWLEKLTVVDKPLVVRSWIGDRLVGLGLFTKKDIRRRCIVRSRTMLLNDYPFDGKNMVIEYNGLLANREYKCAVFVETIKFLLETEIQCDEFYFNAISDTSCLKYLPKAIDRYANLDIESVESTWIVDLTRMDGGRDAFLASLSRSKRSQIRRSLRLYEEKSPLKIEEAEDIDEALRYFDGLKELHTQRWNSIGLPGSFANPIWEDFHRTLIRNNFSKGEIQLLKVSNEDVALGYLYNFVWRKRVYMLQSGFLLPEDNRLMPGYVIHLLAIELNSNKGMNEYDFMYGDSRYKSSLSDHKQELSWLVIRRRSVIFALEKIFLNIGRPIKKFIRNVIGFS